MTLKSEVSKIAGAAKKTVSDAARSAQSGYFSIKEDLPSILETTLLDHPRDEYFSDKKSKYRKLMDELESNMYGSSVPKAQIEKKIESCLGRRAPNDWKIRDEIILEDVLNKVRKGGFKTEIQKLEVKKVLNQIWRQHPLSHGAHFVQTYSDELVAELYLGKNPDGGEITVKDLKENYQLYLQAQTLRGEGWSDTQIEKIIGKPIDKILQPNDEQLKYVQLTEGLSRIARNSTQSFRNYSTKTYGKTSGSRLLNGQHLVLQFEAVQQKAYDLEKGKVENIILRGDTILDSKGRLDKSKLFPETDLQYDIDRCSKNREMLEEATRKALVFQGLFGIGKKLDGLMETSGLEWKGGKSQRDNLDDQTRKLTRLYRAFYADEEGQTRRTLFATEYTKALAPFFNGPIEEYFRKNPNAHLSDISVLKALGLTQEDFNNCYTIEENGGLAVNRIRKVDSFKAIIYAYSKVRNVSFEEAERSLLDFTRNHYANWAFGAIKLPYKGPEGEKELSIFYEGARQFRSRTGHPEHLNETDLQILEAEDANYAKKIEDFFIKQNQFGRIPDRVIEIIRRQDSKRADLLSRTNDAMEALARDIVGFYGGKVVDVNGFSGDVNANVKIMRAPTGEIQIRIITPDGRVEYLTPEETLEYTFRYGNVMQALAFQNTIRQLTRDPLNFPVTWAYGQMGNLILNTVPGAKQASDFFRNILNQRNSILPKHKQLSPKMINDIVQTFVKKHVLSPFFVYDPLTNLIVPRTAYALGAVTSRAFDFLTGTAEQQGVFDKAINNFLRKRKLQDGWEYDIKKNSWEKKTFEAKIFRGITQDQRQKKKMGILEIALRIVWGIVVDGVFDYTISRSRLLSKVYTSVSDTIKHIKSGEFIMERLPEEGGIFSQQGVMNTINWTKTTFGLAGTILKSVGQSLAPAFIWGIATNSPIILIGAGTAALGYNGLINFCQYANSNPFLGNQPWAKPFKNLGGLIDPDSVGALKSLPDFLDAADLFKLPFHLENLFYAKTPILIDHVDEIYKMVRDPRRGVARMLVKPAIDRYGRPLNKWANVTLSTFKGVLKSILGAFNVTGVVYLITGNLFTAIASGAVYVTARVLIENISDIYKWNKSLIGQATKIISPLGGLAIEGIQIAEGIQFLKSMWKAMNAGKKEYEEWKKESFGGAIPMTTSMLTIFGLAEGIYSSVRIVTGFGKALIDFSNEVLVKNFPKIFRAIGAIPLTKYALVGMLIGGAIGMLLGATTGSIVGGMLGGALGSVLGVIATTSITAIITALGTAIGTFVGVGVGGLIGGTLGALLGRWLEVNVFNKMANLGENISAAMNIVGNALNIIKAFQLLLSKDLGDVATAAFMLIIAGVFSFEAIESSQLAASTYIPTDGQSQYVSSPINTAPVIPTQLKDLKKEFIGFGTDGKSIKYKITVKTNSDGKNININITDLLKIEDSSNITSVPVSTKETNGLSAQITSETITSNETKTYEIIFTHATSKFQGDGGIIESQPKEFLCNTATITGNVEGEEDSDFESSSTICIDKDGVRTYSGTAVAEASWQIVSGLKRGWWGYYNYHPDHVDSEDDQDLFDELAYKTANGQEPPCMENTASDCPQKFSGSYSPSELFWCTWNVIYSLEATGTPISRGLTGVTGQRNYFRNSQIYIGQYLSQSTEANDYVCGTSLIQGTKLNIRDIEVGDVAFFGKRKNENCQDFDAHVAIVGKVEESKVITYDSNNYRIDVTYTTDENGYILPNGNIIFNGVGRMK